jgi:hypothetical protein
VRAPGGLVALDEAGDVAAAQRADEVLAAALGVPAEQRGVEGGGLVGIGVGTRDPARDAMFVAVAFAHARSPEIAWLEKPIR